MRRRSAKDQAVKVRAAICHTFRVDWHRYGDLTVREHRVLVEELVAEQNTNTPGGKPGYERVG